jgi:hypothetical protein
MLQHGLRIINRHFAFVAICIVMAARFSFGEVAEGQTPTKNGDVGALAAYDVVSIKPVNPEVTVGGCSTLRTASGRLILRCLRWYGWRTAGF